MSIVKIIALSLRNMYAKFGDIDDIINEGVIALINAVETYDASRGVKFESYASLKIRGGMIDFIRQQDWVPRQVRKFGKCLDTAYSSLYNLHKRVPTNFELAEYLQISEDKLLKGMAEVAGTVTLSFEELLYEDNLDYIEKQAGGTDSADSMLYQKELRSVIAAAIDELKPKEKEVVTLYYYKNMKYSDIARVLEVSESRVCQIHSKAVLTLKTKLQEYLKR